MMVAGYVAVANERASEKHLNVIHDPRALSSRYNYYYYRHPHILHNNARSPGWVLGGFLFSSAPVLLVPPVPVVGCQLWIG